MCFRHEGVFISLFKGLYFSVKGFFLYLITVCLVLAFTRGRGVARAVTCVGRSLESLCPSSRIDDLIHLVVRQIYGVRPRRFLFYGSGRLPRDRGDQVRSVIRHLGRVRPVRCVLKATSFCDLRFRMSPSILVPHPRARRLIRRIVLSGTSRGVGVLSVKAKDNYVTIALQGRLGGTDIVTASVSTRTLTATHQGTGHGGAAIAFVRASVLSPRGTRVSVPFVLSIVIDGPPCVGRRRGGSVRQGILSCRPRLTLFIPSGSPLLCC